MSFAAQAYAQGMGNNAEGGSGLIGAIATEGGGFGLVNCFHQYFTILICNDGISSPGEMIKPLMYSDVH